MRISMLIEYRCLWPCWVRGLDKKLPQTRKYRPDIYPLAMEQLLLGSGKSTVASVVLIAWLVSTAVDIMSHHWTCKPVCRWRKHFPGKGRLLIRPRRKLSADPDSTMSPWEHHLFSVFSHSVLSTLCFHTILFVYIVCKQLLISGVSC